MPPSPPQGYARATGKVGVCCATSGPGATNLVTGLVDAMMDSIPIVAITGQVHSQAHRQRRLPGSRHLRHHAPRHQAQLHGEATSPNCRASCTKLSTSPPAAAPVPCWSISPRTFSRPAAITRRSTSIHLPGYKVFTEGHAGQIRRAAQLIWEAERPFVYAGGGILAGQRVARTARIRRTGRHARPSAP